MTNTVTGILIPDHTRPCDASVVEHQIGRINIFVISGGRVNPIRKNGDIVGIHLPVSRDWSVTVTLDASDTYTVQRLRKRMGLFVLAGEQTNVYCDEVGEVAYQASCYVNVPFGEHNPS